MHKIKRERLQSFFDRLVVSPSEKYLQAFIIATEAGVVVLVIGCRVQNSSLPNNVKIP